MDIYNNTIILIIIIYFFSRFFEKTKRDKIYYVCTGIVLILLLGLRNWEYCGIDLIRYYNQYDELSKASSIQSAFNMRDGGNILYFVTCLILGKMGLSYQAFLFIVASFTVSSSLYLYFKYSKHPILCTSIFLWATYIHLFSQLKQAIAIGFVIISFIFFREQKTNISYILLFVAILFHPTAIIIIPFFVLSKGLLNPMKIGLLLFVAVFVFAFRMQIGALLTLVYDSDYLGHYESTGSMTGTAFLFLILLATFLFLLPAKESVDYDKYKVLSGYFYILVISTCLLFCASYAYSFTRLNSYYLQFVPLIIGEIIESKKIHIPQKWTSVCTSILVAYVMISQFLGMIVSQQLENYKFFWEY